MKLSQFEERMRSFETIYDHKIPEGKYIVVRVDGRGFTTLTKKTEYFPQIPFDERFHDFIVNTTRNLMTCGFSVIYAYTQSDEISLLLSLHDNTFGRETRKLISIFAGTASAEFTHFARVRGVFDCRISVLDRSDLVCDYFRWRQADSYRNSLNSHCYWKLRAMGLNGNLAHKRLRYLAADEKKELLLKEGTDFDALPKWQKWGTGLLWNDIDMVGFNPKDNESVKSARREIQTVNDLPTGDAYTVFLRERIAADTKEAL